MGGPQRSEFKHAPKCLAVPKGATNRKKRNMGVDKRDAIRGQETACSPQRDELQPIAGCSDATKPTGIPPPLTAIRRDCLRCCKDSALEVKLCPAVSCPSWGFRFGRNPTANMLAEVGNRPMYPLEHGISVTEFFENGGTSLKAIRRRCLDCQGYSKARVRGCQDFDCDLHPFRFGRNPNRRMRPDQRRKAAARLKANIKRGKMSPRQVATVRTLACPPPRARRDT